MAKYMKKFARLMLIAALVSLMLLPASAYAASGAAEAKYNAAYATSFFSSLTDALSFWFDKEESASYGGYKESGGWLSWLKGKDHGDKEDWWEDNKHDSYKLWKKYYCY
ncbi:hypothetical protein J2Z22_004412 [Paenibacillus forsythiae]|uniref:Uncharacterized protein n=1 Tax=Paenibacillus forsythiae TaxID=365616 RepID=A0ABU3HDB8_9BACL|nr:hypothetical protein [Paenibacillus forsythiae]MDT3428818.1 hypothetical protein [Paenibacillus forsythiae]